MNSPNSYSSDPSPSDSSASDPSSPDHLSLEHNFWARVLARPVAVLVFTVMVALLGAMAWGKLPLNLFPDMQSPVIMVSVDVANKPALQMEREFGERIEQRLFTVAGIERIEQVARRGRINSKITFRWNSDINVALLDVNRAVASFAANPDIDAVTVKRIDANQRPVMNLGLLSTNASAEAANASNALLSPASKPISEPPSPPVSRPVSLYELRRLAKRQIAPNLEQISGVAEARIRGGRVKQVQVQIDPVQLKAYGLTVAQIQERISNSNQDFSAGTVENGNQALLVRGQNRFIAADDVANVVIKYLQAEDGSHRPLRVSDVAEVVSQNAPITGQVRINGTEGIGIAIYKESDANVVALSETILASLNSLNASLPNAQIVLVNNQADTIVAAIANLQQSALLGLILAIIVLAVFLRSSKPVLVVAVSLPVSLLASVFALHIGNYSLNLMTLGGLALGIGLLIDNAIVIIESIYRYRDLGYAPHQAAILGVQKVGGAIVAGTLTTCVVFLPAIFIEGMAAKIVSGLAFTVITSLLGSLLVALFVIPVLSVGLRSSSSNSAISNRANSESTNSDRTLSRTQAKTEHWIQRILAMPGRILLLALALVAVAISSLMGLGTQLLPSSGQQQFTLDFTAPAGQTVQATAHTTGQIEHIIAQAAGDSLHIVQAEVGKLEGAEDTFATRNLTENSARLEVVLNNSDPAQSAASVIAAAAPAVDKLHGIETTWRAQSAVYAQALGETAAPIVVQVSGFLLADIRRVTEQIQQVLSADPAFWNVQTSFEGGGDDIHIALNRTLAQRLGISQSVFQTTLEAALDGLYSTELNQGDETQDIVLQLKQPAHTFQPSSPEVAGSHRDITHRASSHRKITRQALENLTFVTPEGQHVRVGDIATLTEQASAKEILRADQRRIAQITALVSPNVSLPQARATAAQHLQNALPLPAGITATLAGEELTRAATINELNWAVGLSVLLVFMVLAGTLESLFYPFVILLAIPLALIGVAAILVPMGEPIGIMAMLGAIVLAGIAVNNAILLLQTTQQHLQQGLSVEVALARAVAIRLRPVLMTSLTTIFSLLPLALSLTLPFSETLSFSDSVISQTLNDTSGAALREPLAFTLLGGMVASTVGCLVVLPCAFLLMYRLRGADSSHHAHMKNQAG